MLGRRLILKWKNGQSATPMPEEQLKLLKLITQVEMSQVWCWTETDARQAEIGILLRIRIAILLTRLPQNGEVGFSDWSLSHMTYITSADIYLTSNISYLLSHTWQQISQAPHAVIILLSPHMRSGSADCHFYTEKTWWSFMKGSNSIDSISLEILSRRQWRNLEHFHK